VREIYNDRERERETERMRKRDRHRERESEVDRICTFKSVATGERGIDTEGERAREKESGVVPNNGIHIRI